MDTTGFPTDSAPNPPSPIDREQSVEESRLNDMVTNVNQISGDPATDIFATERDHLSQASLGLTEALHRLQQLRTSIAGLADRYPNANARAVEEGNGVGPAHAAIIISPRGGNSEQSTARDESGGRPPVRLRTNIPSAAMNRLEEFEARRAARTLPVRRVVRAPSSTTWEPQSSTSNSAPSPPRVPQRRGNRSPPLPDLLISSRRDWLDTAISTQNRDTSPDDSSTALGRRVTARAAARATSVTTPGFSEVDQRILNRTTELAYTLERAMQLNRTSELADGLERAVQDLRSETTGGSHLLRSARARREDDGFFGQPMNGSTFPAPIGTMPTRSSSSTDTSSRFERMDYIRQEVHRITAGRPAHINTANDAQNRNYLVRRRLNADGEEHVHTIDLETWQQEDAADWLMPSVPPIARQNPDLPTPTQRDGLIPAEHRQQLTRFERNLYRTVQEPPMVSEDRSRRFVASAPRRRGWARLNADGVEITTEEEVDQERNRLQEFWNAFGRVQSSDLIETYNLEERAARRETLVPMTRTSITPSSPGAAAPARVRINPPPPWAETILDIHPEDPSSIRTYPHQYGSSDRDWDAPLRRPSPPSEPYVPFVPDPLPMPLATMGPQVGLPHSSPPAKIKVHVFASIAGR